MSKWSAQVNVKWKPGAPAAEDWSWLAEWDEVKWAWTTPGEWDMVLWVDAGSQDDLESFVHNKLRKKDWVQDTKSTWMKELWHAA